MLKKRLITLLLAMVMLAAFGCNDQTASSQPTQNPGTSSSGGVQSGTDYELSAPGQFPIVSSGTAELTAFVAPPVTSPDFDNNEFTAFYEEMTGVHVTWMYTTEEDHATRLSLLLSGGGELPDIIGKGNMNRSEVALYGSKGIFVPLNDAIDKQATNIKSLFEEYPFYKEQITSAGGSIYMLGNPMPPLHTEVSSKMWIYQPWLDKLNIETPTTTEDFYQMLKAFKEKDPNGNNQHDEVPLVGTPSAKSWQGDPLPWIMNSFTIYGEPQMGLQVVDGKIVASYTTDEYKEGLKYMQRLYSEGLIAGETYTQDQQQLMALCSQETNVVGAVSNGLQINFQTIDDEHTGWKDWVGLEPVEGPGGVRYAAYYPQDFSAGAYGLVTRACEDVELAVRWMDGLYTLGMTQNAIVGPEGKYWRFAKEGEGIDGVGDPAGLVMIPVTGAKNNSWGQSMPWGYGMKQPFGTLIEGKPEDHWDAVLNLLSESYRDYLPDRKNLLPASIVFNEKDAKTISDFETSVFKGYVAESQARFITGNSNIDAEWDSYLARLEQMNLKEYLALYQAAYDALKK